MTAVLLIAPALAMGCNSGAGGAGMAAHGSLATFSDSASYAVGQGLGQSIKDRHVEVDMGRVIQGLTDALGDGETQLSLQEIGPMMQRLGQEGMKKWNEEQGGKNKTEGEAFLATNGQRPEVTTTASGLQYEVLTEGTGPRPKATDRVKVHYHGTLIDGSVFDSSRERGEPATFQLNQVIPGWTEGLQLMPVGSTYKFYIPSDLAYGDQGNPRLGPNATLIFEVELLSIEN